MPTQGLQQLQKQTQTLVLAPQLRQSLKILQAPALELRNTILEELEINPTLEELPMDGVSIDDETAGEETTDRENGAHELDLKEDYQVLNQLDEDWRDYFAQESGASSYSAQDAERRQHYFDSIPQETSIQEYLVRQAKLSDIPESILEAFIFLVGSLDDRGYVSAPLSDLSLYSEHSLRNLQRAQELLKTLDPPGIGTENLQDCLLVQLEQANKGDGLAADIIREHFVWLLRRRIPEISKGLRVSIDTVEEAIREIAALDPAPGRKFGEDQNHLVEPDVKVERDGDQWVITLNNDYIPRLRLSSTYKNLIARGNLSQKEKEYIQHKIRSGRFLMSAIEQRQQTIERITREILKFQGAFFEKGVSGLRPLTMSTVADEVGVHETTISRALANKFIATPHGVFAFKYFFTTGYTGRDGIAVANTTVKDRIARLIDSENPAKPLSDQEIANILKEENLKIARRTVAKYREEVGIMPTNLRRRYL